MIGLTLSTPDRCNTFVSGRPYRAVMRAWGWKEGHAVYYFGDRKPPRYVGVIIKGQLVRPLSGVRA